MTHAEFYQLPPAGRIPRPGDAVRVNYGTGLYTGYVIEKVFEPDPRQELGAYPVHEPDTYGFQVRVNRADRQTTPPGWLNNYRLVGDRLVGRALPPGSCGYHSNGGGLDGDGRDEIRIERPARQGWLL